MAINTLFENIADAIRAKAGTSGLITPAQMPAAIAAIPTTGVLFQITVTGGYNGGAIISVKFNGSEVFQSTGDRPYNLIYTPPGGTVTSPKGNVTITITPPASSTGNLIISLSGAITYTTENITPEGANTSYGYNYDSGLLVG